MELTVQWTERNDEALVDLAGTITLGKGEVKLRTALDELLDRGRRRRISLDLGKVSHVDSAGLGELVNCWRRVHEQGGTLRILNPSDRVSDLLRVTQLAAMFGIRENEEMGSLG